MQGATERRVLAAFAGKRQLRTSEAREFGVDRLTLARAATAGVIKRAGRGVYLAPDQPSAPAVVADSGATLGPHAVLGYRGAAAFYGLAAVAPGTIEWIVPHSGTRPRRLPPGVARVYRRRRFDDLEIVEVGGVRVTSVRQTLADVAGITDIDVVERMIESALRLDLVSELLLRDFAYIGIFARHGGPALRAVLDRRPCGVLPTDSDVETLLLQLYRKFGMPHFERQWPIYGPDGQIIARADCGFPPFAFGTEVDGLESHGTKSGLQYDLNRQNRVFDTGFSLRRFTYDDVVYRQRYVWAATLRGLKLASLL
jgi:hypothetical protein